MCVRTWQGRCQSCGAASIFVLLQQIALGAALSNKTSTGIKEAMADFGLSLQGLRRIPSGGGNGFVAEIGTRMRARLVVHTASRRALSRKRGA